MLNIAQAQLLLAHCLFLAVKIALFEVLDSNRLSHDLLASRSFCKKVAKTYNTRKYSRNPFFHFCLKSLHSSF